MKKILKILGVILLAVILAAGSFIGYLTVTEYKPAPIEDAEGEYLGLPLSVDAPLTILSWNIGYAGLDQTADFFMDGGSMVYPTSQENVLANITAVRSYLDENPADLVMLQEVDRDSSRSGHIDEMNWLDGFRSSAYAPNYRCAFVPFPLPPIGKVESGIVTLAKDASPCAQPQRVKLPCPFSWPVSAANLKRCLLVERYALILDGQVLDQELVLVNLHLEAYDDGEGKAAQTEQLLQLLQEEYAKGNYVIAGGDFNQTFPGALDAYPMQSAELWAPGVLEQSALPEGWSFQYDASSPSCRSLDRALDAQDPTMQYYIIDGFLVSPNVTVQSVQTENLGFANSDHNPVRMEVLLGQ